MKIEKKHTMLFLLFIGYIVIYIDKTIIGLIMLNIEKDLHLSSESVGYIAGCFFLAYSMFQIPAGLLNDIIGYKKVLIFSLTLIITCAFLFGAIGSTIALLVVFRFLAGVGHSGYPCSCAKAVSTNFSVDERTLAQSILLSTAGIAGILGPVIVSYTLPIIGWRWIYISLAILAVLILSLFVFMIPAPAKNKQSDSHAKNKISYLSLLKEPVVVLSFIASFGVNMPAYGLMVWLPKYLVNVRNLNIEWAAYIIALGGLAQWLSSVGSGWIVGKFFKNKEKKVIVVSAVISSASIMLVYLNDSIIVSTLFVFIAYIFLMTTFVTIFTLPMKMLPQEITGSAVGLVNTGGTLGGFVSPIVIGLMLSTTNSATPSNFALAFMFLASGMLLSGIAILPLKQTNTK